MKKIYKFVCGDKTEEKLTVAAKNLQNLIEERAIAEGRYSQYTRPHNKRDPVAPVPSPAHISLVYMHSKNSQNKTTFPTFVSVKSNTSSKLTNLNNTQIKNDVLIQLPDLSKPNQIPKPKRQFLWNDSKYSLKKQSNKINEIKSVTEESNQTMCDNCGELFNNNDNDAVRRHHNHYENILNYSLKNQKFIDLRNKIKQTSYLLDKLKSELKSIEIKSHQQIYSNKSDVQDNINKESQLLKQIKLFTKNLNKLKSLTLEYNGDEPQPSPIMIDDDNINNKVINGNDNILKTKQRKENCNFHKLNKLSQSPIIQSIVNIDKNQSLSSQYFEHDIIGDILLSNENKNSKSVINNVIAEILKVSHKSKNKVNYDDSNIDIEVISIPDESDMNIDDLSRASIDSEKMINCQNLLKNNVKIQFLSKSDILQSINSLIGHKNLNEIAIFVSLLNNNGNKLPPPPSLQPHISMDILDKNNGEYFGNIKISIDNFEYLLNKNFCKNILTILLMEPTLSSSSSSSSSCSAIHK